VYERNVQWVEDLVRQQNAWRVETINLIASENVLSNRAREVMGSDFAHRYAEGHPGERYYQGTDKIDEIEARAKQHLKTLFGARNVDVRPISGTVANEAIFSRYVRPGDICLVHSTPAGGHISHHRAGSLGKYTENIVDLPMTEDGYHVDVPQSVYLIDKLRPRLVVLGKSLFLFPDPIRELATACKRAGATIVYDAAHVLGLVAGKVFQNPLAEGADLVTGSTHKTFFGSQRGVILANVGANEWRKIDKGAFPASSSNHHLDTLVALAIATYEMLDFGEEYARQVVKNAKALAAKLAEYGFAVQAAEFGYTETHQVVVDVRELGGGDGVSRMLNDNGIILNMNLLPFEPLDHVLNPAGIRIGVQEMTRFGMNEPEMEIIAALFKRCLMDGVYVGDEVKGFRREYQRVRYSFDAE
jgi:glycine hydroxymethyltransferase